jgi:outer membrane protein OmpA-like peptidoglycan-associated protein
MKIVYPVLLGVVVFAACRTPQQKKKAYMRRTYHAIRKAVKEAEVSSLNDSVRVIFPCNLMFGFNSASIKSELQPSIKRFSRALNKFEKTAVLIAGHTDNVGEDEYNDRLSGQRADTAKSALATYDVNPLRISTWGMGKKHPIASNETEEGRAKNRRVEFVVLYEAKK